jgi:hypothetical protein
MHSLIQVTLETGPDGRARFRETPIPLDQGDPALRLSRPFQTSEMQLRQSPVGFRSPVHVTTRPQWVFILAGTMEIGLLDGSSRSFTAGQHFYSADTLPENTPFDPEIHGHWSRQVGDEPLVTLFVRP